MLNGAGGLSEEVASSKITGEEDRYSGTDLYDFQANVDGAEKIVELVQPLLKQANSGLADQINASGASHGYVLAGGGGNDVIYGSAYADQLYGGDGNDTFYTQDGITDIVRGEGGTDTLATWDSFDNWIE